MYLFFSLYMHKITVREWQGEAEMTVLSVFAVCGSFMYVVIFKNIGWGVLGCFSWSNRERL
jgi:hypothetical protein